jgi:hypothetical protein
LLDSLLQEKLERMLQSGCRLMRRLPSSVTTSSGCKMSSTAAMPDKLYQKIDLEFRVH